MKRGLSVLLMILLLLTALPAFAQEQVLFSDPTSTGGVVLVLLTDGAAAEAASAPFASFAGKNIGVQTGTISGEVAQSVIPDIQVSYYNLQTDVLAALRANKN